MVSFVSDLQGRARTLQYTRSADVCEVKSSVCSDMTTRDDPGRQMRSLR